MIISKEDARNILGWAGFARQIAENHGVPFDASELATLEKLRAGLGARK